MSVDCRIYLPHSARIHDIAEVIGILVGFKKEKMPLDRGDAWYVRVEGVKVSAGLPQMCIIGLEKNDFNAQMVYCHFEADRRDGKSMAGYKSLSSSSRPVWCAIGKRLVDTFGGLVIYNEGNDKVDYRRPKRSDNDANDGDEWQKFQERIFAIEPLTKAEVKAMKAHAAYSD